MSHLGYIFSGAKHKNKVKRRKLENTQDADLSRVAKANRCSGLMVSFALMKRRMACLIESKRVRGRPFGPLTFISTRDSWSTSMQKSMSSLHIRDGLRVYLFAAELSPSVPSMTSTISIPPCPFLSCQLNKVPSLQSGLNGVVSRQIT